MNSIGGHEEFCSVFNDCHSTGALFIKVAFFYINQAAADRIYERLNSLK